ncbi:DUF805 domain-containing protein [Alistipes sp.]|uniref:DUF805 domain-containing protein n=1 Tax=Alistipes sp. TaxID=1872444 RepID=UPI003AF13492
MKWFVKCIKNYVNFSGRARRAEYWYFVLFSVIFAIAAMILDKIVFGKPNSVFYALWGLFIFLPGLAVQVRRLHDTGHSGKMLLWFLIAEIVWMVLLVVTGLSFLMSAGAGSPSILFLIIAILGGLGIFVWGIFFLVWYCTAGDKGENKYGPDPLAE